MLRDITVFTRALTYAYKCAREHLYLYTFWNNLSFFNSCRFDILVSYIQCSAVRCICFAHLHCKVIQKKMHCKNVSKQKNMNLKFVRYNIAKLYQNDIEILNWEKKSFNQSRHLDSVCNSDIFEKIIIIQLFLYNCSRQFFLLSLKIGFEIMFFFFRSNIVWPSTEKNELIIIQPESIENRIKRLFYSGQFDILLRKRYVAFHWLHTFIVHFSIITIHSDI